MRPASLLPALLLLSLAACGSRSGMAELGAGAAGAGGSAGSGGELDCVSMSSTTQVRELLRPAGWIDHNPAIVRSSDDGERVSVAAVSGPPDDDPWPQTLEQHHAAFEPWKAWPANPVLQPTYDPWGGGFIMPRFSLAEAPGDGFAWFGSAWNIKGSTGAFLYLMDALSDGVPGWEGAWNVPIAVAALDSQFQGHQLMLSQRQADGAYVISMPYAPHWVGCSAQPVGDARVFKGGYIVAFATVGSPGADGSCAPSSKEATRIEVVRISGKTGPKSVAGLETGAHVTDISLAPHPDGAILVYRSGGAASALHFARVSAASQQVVGPYALTVTADEAMPGIDTAEVIGRRLAVAWGSPKGVNVTLLDEDGARVTETVLPAPVTGRVGIVSSKQQPSVVVTWGEAPGATRVTRFDCQGGVL